ncbi:MAG: molybdopterin-dependent oxidoreductase [Chloroflexi bacterium]|nr:molybdopterin-dependent oxidoreductase [Chloroflexota bacterium]
MRGRVAETTGRIPFARSLPLEKALHPDTLLAFAMNGELLPSEHGYPLRLIVPGWYGIASVKWLTRITAVGDSFDDFFQTSRYVMVSDRRNNPVPLAETRVRSVVVQPSEGAELLAWPIRLAGYAWSGGAPVSLVEVSTDGGPTWQPAQWTTGEQRYAWRRWEYCWTVEVPGEVILQSRARDGNGKVQPAVGEWNELGYANSAVQSVRVVIVE